MQHVPAIAQAGSDWSSAAASNMFVFPYLAPQGGMPHRGSGPADASPQHGGYQPLMRTFAVTHDGLAELASLSPPCPPLTFHEEPVWRTESAVTRLMTAVKAGDLQALAEQLGDPSVRATINAEDGSGRSALDHALERKAFRAAHMLVRQGAKLADKDVLNPQLLVELIRADERALAREVAARRNALLSNSQPVASGDALRRPEPLFLAIVAEDVELVSLLLDTLSFTCRDAVGNSPLHYGAAAVTPRMLPFLLSRLPADPLQRQAALNAPRTDGRTPLMHAALSNRPTAVAVLLRAGAAPDAVDRKGESAMHKAACSGLLEIGRLLLAMGARTDLRDLRQQTPMAMARAHGRPDFVQLLEAFGVQG